MKGIDLFCASPASTAVCNRRSDLGGRRRGHRPVGDGDISSNKLCHVPCSSQLPILPQPTYNYKFHHEKSRKSTDNIVGRKSSADVRSFKRSSSTPHGDSSTYLLSDHRSPRIHDLLSGFDKVDGDEEVALVNTRPPAKPKLASSSSANQSPALKLYSCSSARDQMAKQCAGSTEFRALKTCSSARERPKQQSTGSTEFLALKSCGSAREHAAGSADQFLALKSSSSARQVMSSKQQECSSTDDSPATKSSNSSAQSRDQQVVVLRVSIHCKGCEGKVRKHISKMEGVRSFSIDRATKKVIVIGDVTPLGVLASVSRVKNAQLWPSSSPLILPPATHQYPYAQHYDLINAC